MQGRIDLDALKRLVTEDEIETEGRGAQRFPGVLRVCPLRVFAILTGRDTSIPAMRFVLFLLTFAAGFVGGFLRKMRTRSNRAQLSAGTEPR